MQHIYRSRDEQFEVYTTVFSPKGSRSTMRTRPEDKEDAEKVVAVMQHQSNWQRELDLNRGDLIQVLFKKDQAWWYGRMKNGKEGFFPAACVEALQDEGSGGSLVRRGSVPVPVTVTKDVSLCAGTRTPKPLRTNRPGGSADPAHGSSSLLLRVLAKSRRKSCPHLPHHPPGTGSINIAFQSD